MDFFPTHFFLQSPAVLGEKWRMGILLGDKKSFDFILSIINAVIYVNPLLFSFSNYINESIGHVHKVTAPLRDCLYYSSHSWEIHKHCCMKRKPSYPRDFYPRPLSNCRISLSRFLPLDPHPNAVDFLSQQLFYFCFCCYFLPPKILSCISECSITIVFFWKCIPKYYVLHNFIMIDLQR